MKAGLELKICKRPTFSDKSTTVMEVMEGDTATLECYASGVPEPNITWRREDNNILPVGGLVYR